MNPRLQNLFSQLGLTPSAPPTPDQWEKLQSKLDDWINGIDVQQRLAQRSLEISLNEMKSLYKALRQSSEAELLEGKIKLESTIQAMSDPVILFNEQLQIDQLNASAAKILNVLSEDIFHRSINDMVNLPTLPEGITTDLLSDCVNKGSVIRDDEVAIMENGQMRYYSVIISPVSRAQSLNGGVMIMRNITRERQAQISLQNAHRLEQEASQAKTTFVATMSHEIRTPLNGIKGMLQLLSMSDLSPQDRLYVETAIHSSEALLSIVNDVLDFSKAESGALKMERIEVDLLSLLDDILNIYSPQFASKGVRLLAKIQPNMPHFVWSDPVRLRQILMNYVSNALKFTQQGQVVVAVDIRPNGRYRLGVSDTGVGIPVTAQKRLFSAFSQVDLSTTRKYGGTGLGLNIVKRIAEAMGGKVGVVSQEGKGSEFFVELPLEAVDERIFAPSSRLSGQWLLVDPDPSRGQWLKNLLESWGADEVIWQTQPQPLVRVNLTGAIIDKTTFTLPTASLWPEVSWQQVRQIKLVMNTAIEAQDELATPIRLASLLRVLGHSQPGLVKPETQRVKIPLVRDMLRILLVEDNEVNRLVATKLLESLGYQVQSAVNGQEALDLLACDQDFVLILMDGHMPVMDGYETTARILAHEDWRKIPIIGLTADVGVDAAKKCETSGMVGCLHKPIDMPRLKSTLFEIIGR